MNALGRHLLVELNDCDREVLNDLDLIRDAMMKAAIDCGAVVLGESFHHFSPQGVSGVVVIAEISPIHPYLAGIRLRGGGCLYLRHYRQSRKGGRGTHREARV